MFSKASAPDMIAQWYKREIWAVITSFPSILKSSRASETFTSSQNGRPLLNQASCTMLSDSFINLESTSKKLLELCKVLVGSIKQVAKNPLSRFLYCIKSGEYKAIQLYIFEIEKLIRELA